MIWKIISVLRKQAVGLQQAFSGLRMLVAALQQAFSGLRKSAVNLQQAFSGSRMSVAALQLVFSELRRIMGVISNFSSPYLSKRKSSVWNVNITDRVFSCSAKRVLVVENMLQGFRKPSLHVESLP